MTPIGKKWFRITACENIPVREGRVAEIAGHQIAIFNLGERFLAVENRCPHRGGPLADGIVSGNSVVCPLHAWKYDLASGAVENHPESQACLATFPIRVEAGIVSVELLPIVREQTSAATSERADRPVRWVQRKSAAISGVSGATIELC
jgi:nitrite reductase (NADH) small subunit